MKIKGMLKEIMKLRLELNATTAVTLDETIARMRLINRIRNLEAEVVRTVQAVCRDHLEGLQRQVKVTQNACLEVTLKRGRQFPSLQAVKAIKAALKQEGVWDWQLTVQLHSRSKPHQLVA